MDGVGFIFHVNEHGMVLHAESFGVNGLQYMPEPRLKCFGMAISKLYPTETAIRIQIAIDMAFKTGPSYEAYPFSYTHKKGRSHNVSDDFSSRRELVGRAAYLRKGIVLVVVELGLSSL